MNIEEAKKQAKQAILPINKKTQNLAGVVEFLQDCKRNGQNIYVIHNCLKLYSCDVTYDSACIQLHQMTKQEEEEIMQGLMDSQTLEEREDWYNKGLEIIKRHGEEVRDDAVNVKVPGKVKTREAAVEYLKHCRYNGQNVYMDFNDGNNMQRLYSYGVDTIDGYFASYGLLIQQERELRESAMDSIGNIADRVDVLLKRAAQGNEDKTKTKGDGGRNIND